MPDLVWEDTVDNGVWTAQVERLDNGGGRLTVFRTSDRKEILRRDVTLAYGAVFGPDVDDVEFWQHLVIEAIDSRQEV